MIKIVDLLHDLIDRERGRIKNSYPSGNIYIRKQLLLELVRAVDSFYGSRSSFNIELISLYQYGWNEILGLIYGEYADKGQFPLSPSTAESWNWANSAIQHCGRIAFVKKIISFYEAKLARVEEGKNREIIVSFNDVSDWEKFDRESLYWFQDLIGKHIVDPQISNLDSAGSKRIWELQKRKVNRWKDYFIQYNSTPEIDEYYSKRGHFVSLNKEGRENFPENAEFGNITYRDYCLVTEEIIAMVLKHLGFCATLCEKYSDIDLKNIISITIELDKLSNSLSHYLDINPEKIQKILTCLTLTHENFNYHVQIPQGPPMPFIKAGNNLVIHSIAGSLSNPYEFLNRELRRKFEKDYFQAVNERESILRKQLYSMFPEEYFRKVENIAVGKDRDKTDIDATIFDSSTGTLALFQLKWQETFGSSIKERGSRLKNFYDKTVGWIDKISLWIQQNRPKVILSSLRLDGKQSLNKSLLFVINRNSVFFTGVKPDGRAAWSTLYQLIRVFSEISKVAPDRLGVLHNKLIKTSPVFRKRAGLEDESFELGGYTFILKDNMKDASVSV